MLARFRAQITYANVMSTIAVFLALGGGAAYAANEWTGENIQDGTITGDDIQGNLPDLQNAFVDGSLTTADIRDGSIFPSDIADNQLGPADVGPLGSDELINNAVRGNHVADDSLDGFDVQNLSGSDLIDGSVGANDLAAGVRGFNRVTTRQRSKRLDRGERANELATCPTGWTAISGGYGHSASRDPEDFAVSSNVRHSARSWQVVGRHVGGIGADRLTLHVMVVCAQ